MADNTEQQMDNENNTAESKEIQPDENEPKANLHAFVKEEYQRQRKQSGDVAIDDDRINNFFARAVSESNRMSSEVDKSHDRLRKLHTELGEETFNEWRQQHCSEVLKPSEAQLVELSMQDTAQQMDQS